MPYPVGQIGRPTPLESDEPNEPPSISGEPHAELMMPPATKGKAPKPRAPATSSPADRGAERHLKLNDGAKP